MRAPVFADSSAVVKLYADEPPRLAARYGLRAYDAVQLASASATDEAAAKDTSFVAFDQTLVAAAAAEGLRLLSGAA